MPGCFSPLGKLAGRAIYFACVNFFFFSFFYYEQSYVDLLDRFSRSFRQMEGICVNFLDQVQFFRIPIPQGTLPWQPILFRTGHVQTVKFARAVIKRRHKRIYSWRWRSTTDSTIAKPLISEDYKFGNGQ